MPDLHSPMANERLAPFSSEVACFVHDHCQNCYILRFKLLVWIPGEIVKLSSLYVKCLADSRQCTFVAGSDMSSRPDPALPPVSRQMPQVMRFWCCGHARTVNLGCHTQLLLLVENDNQLVHRLRHRKVLLFDWVNLPRVSLGFGLRMCGVHVLRL